MEAIESFDFADAPLSWVGAPLIGGAVYLTIVVALARYMRVVRGGVGVNTKWLQAVHNLVLCVGSLIMFLGTLRELTLRVGRESGSPETLGGAHWLFCESVDTQPRGALFFWSYVYYLSKYYELLDTVLQLLKGRPPPHFFLHVYHHAVVLVMAWSWLAYVQTLAFLGLLFNVAVHVVMYYYYFLRVMGTEPWWKRFVTKFQIIQFCTSGVCLLVTVKLMTDGSQCAGPTAMAFNLAFNATLLWQFVGVLKPKKGKAESADGAAKMKKKKAL